MYLHLPVSFIIALYYLLLPAITIFIASISYTYFEKYFLNIKNKMQYSTIKRTI